MHQVLVTDGEQRSSLAVVRSLGRAGYQVEVCSAYKRPLAGASKYSRAEYLTPDPGDSTTAYMSALSELVRQRGIGVLIPMTDVSASVVLGLRAVHPELVIPFPGQDVWDQVADKQRLMEVASEVGVPVPRQMVVRDHGEELASVRDWASDIGYPVILKPHRSAVVKETGVRKFGVRIVSSGEELSRQLGAFSVEAFPVLVQECIRGPGLGAFFLSMDGEVVASFGHRRLREKPPTGGVSVLRESVPLREDLRRHSEALLRYFRWSGVAMVEFKEDASTGTPYLMEINGRFWGSLQLAIDAGVDFPTLLLERFLAADRKPMAAARTDYVTGIRSRWLWGDLDHLIWMLRAPLRYRGLDRTLPSRFRALLQFLSPSFFGQRFEVLRVDDMRPFVRESVEWVSTVAGLRSGRS